MAQGASAEKAVREIRGRCARAVVAAVSLACAPRTDPTLCTPGGLGTRAQVLRAHKEGHPQATDRVSERQTEPDQELTGGPSRVRT